MTASWNLNPDEKYDSNSDSEPGSVRWSGGVFSIVTTDPTLIDAAFYALNS